jgi:hypothetical protein
MRVTAYSYSNVFSPAARRLEPTDGHRNHDVACLHQPNGRHEANDEKAPSGMVFRTGWQGSIL